MITERLHKFFALSPAERTLLLYALFLVGAVRSALTLLPFRRFKRLMVEPVVREERIPSDRLTPERITWCVERASDYIPGATCLTQALVARRLLARSGYRSQLQIGVARGADGEFIAHAWLERDESILIGGHGYRDFTTLPQVDTRLG